MIYRGGDVQYLVRLPDDHILSARQSSADMERQLSPGKPVFVCFAARSAQLLQEAASE
ncbi:MAG: TOBE domain-containing protein [Candidatus Entotheonellia bacterium]